LSYQVNQDGKITNLANGQEVVKDVTSPQYQQYQYWQAHGINLTQAPIVEEIKLEADKVETFFEKIEDKVIEIEEYVEHKIKGQ